MEDDWIDQSENDSSVCSRVTLAAFHPEWEFGGDEDDNGGGLDFEKRSPHPTITFVWTKTIDAAGPEATERIADHNAQVLGEEMDWEQVRDLYDRVVWRKHKSCDDC